MRVLLVRLDGIGDAAVCVPLIAALREAGHVVGVALSTRNAGVFAPAAIEAEHVLERIPWPAHGSTPQSTALASAQIAQQRYDVALVASEEPEAYTLAQGIAVRVGFTTGLLRPLKNLWVRSRLTRTVSRSQHLGGRAGAHEVEVMYRLGTTLVAQQKPSADPQRLRPILRSGDVPARTDAPLVLQAGAKWAALGVDDAALRAFIAGCAGRAVRVVAAPAERAAAAAALGVDVESFSDLQGWIAALDASAVVITPDSGAAHVAGMLGVPVIDVFPDANFEIQSARWRPWAAPSTAVRASAFGSASAQMIEAAAMSTTAIDGR